MNEIDILKLIKNEFIKDEKIMKTMENLAKS